MTAVAVAAGRLCALCGVPWSSEHFVSDPRHAARWWTQQAIRHVRLVRICDEPHTGKPCRAWHIGQAVQARGYARELRRRHGF